MPTFNGQIPPTHRHSHGKPTLLSRLLELDSHIHERLLDEALDAVASHVHHDRVRRIMDVGAGTGAATFRLSARYPQAEVIALDANPAMTQQVAARVAGEHIRPITRPVLAVGLEAGSIDLAWASSVAHEFDNPVESFKALSEVIRPDGVLAIMEMDGPPRVLPTRYDGLESRLRQLANADTPGPEWATFLAAAGFELLEKNTLVSDQQLPADGIGGDYARAELHRLALHATGSLNAEEKASLSQILESSTGTPSLPHVHIRGTRSLWIARHL